LNLLSALLPGFREVRAPLIGGYLWLFFAWLLLRANDALPERSDSQLLADLFDLGDSIGKVGLAITASVAAYVVGSLVIQVLQWIWSAPGHTRALFGPILQFGEAVARFGTRQYLPLSSVLGAYEPTQCRTLDATLRITRSLEEIAEREIEGAMKRLHNACLAAERQVAEARSGEQGPTAEVVAYVEGEIILESDPEARYRVPRFSAARDIFGERGAILARLMDLSPFIGSKIDRLQAESEFRFAVAWPLLAISMALAATTEDLLWLLIIPLALLLLVHGIGLHRDASLELVDALRTRTSEQVVELTPAYQRYRGDAGALSDGVERMDWREWATGREAQMARSGSTVRA
jgi:hypothetical protein